MARTAILYDWLYHKEGGGERMLFEILDLYPEADLITLTYNKERYQGRLKSRIVRTSWLNRLPKALRQRPQWLLPWVQSAVRHLPTKGYDELIAVSSAWVKNVPLRPHQTCTVYCYSPARMLWDAWPAALDGRTHNPIMRFLVTILASHLRLWDYYESQQSRRNFIAISQTIQARIAKFYHRQSKLVYPVVELDTASALTPTKTQYYIVVSVLARYKNIELAIRACRQAERRLVIVGDGPDRERLEQLAGDDPLIEFRGWVEESEKFSLLAGAQGFIFCSHEDFGIAPVEALAVGTPVVALAGGGVSETVPAGTGGVFFDHSEPAAVIAALKKLEAKDWDKSKMQTRAKRYSRSAFRRRWKQAVRRTPHADTEQV